MGESWNEDAKQKWRVRRGGGAVDKGGQQPGEGRRPSVRAADVVAVLALVVSVVLGGGTWRTYLAESAAGEDGEEGECQGRALVKPKEVIKPMAVAANTPLHCSGTRR